jgi:hypothetical protein
VINLGNTRTVKGRVSALPKGSEKNVVGTIMYHILIMGHPLVVATFLDWEFL